MDQQSKPTNEISRGQRIVARIALALGVLILLLMLGIGLLSILVQLFYVA